MRVVFAGSPDTALPSLQRLLDDSPHDLVGVVSRPDARSGRGRHTAPSPVAALARERGLPTLTPRKASDPDFHTELRSLEPDVCAVVAYGALLPRAALDIPIHGWVNLHFSLLPAWRGAAPVQYSIWRGDEVTGASTFLIEEALDSGPVYGMVTETIRPRDTAGDVLGRLADSGATLLSATMDGIADGSLRAEPQDADGASYAPKISTDDARVDWQQPAFAIDRQVRAMTPHPGAWTEHGGRRLHLGPLRPAAETEGLAPGEIHAEKHRTLVGTATEPVELGEVTPQGRKPMAAEAWARGARPQPGETFG